MDAQGLFNTSLATTAGLITLGQQGLKAEQKYNFAKQRTKQVVELNKKKKADIKSRLDTLVGGING